MEKEKLYDKWTATGLETIKVCVEDKIANYCELNKKQCQEVLNLIEKQQEEIKARLEEIDSLYKMMSAKDDIINFKDDEIKYQEEKLEQYVDTPEFEENYISKDKIRNIIFEFIPKSNHEVELRTKIIKLLGE